MILQITIPVELHGSVNGKGVLPSDNGIVDGYSSFLTSNGEGPLGHGVLLLHVC